MYCATSFAHAAMVSGSGQSCQVWCEPQIRAGPSWVIYCYLRNAASSSPGLSEKKTIEIIPRQLGTLGVRTP